MFVGQLWQAIAGDAKMSVLTQAILALTAAVIISQLLGDLPYKNCLALATGCFYFVHPVPMSFGLAALIFWDLVRSGDDSAKFMLLPTLGGALVTGFAALPLRDSLLAAVSAQSAVAPGLPAALNWVDCLRTCLAMPLLEQYVCLIVVLTGLIAKGIDKRYAFLVTALFFALLQGQPSAFLTRALAGSIYVWLYSRHGFWSAVTAQGLSSAGALLVTLWLP